MQLAYPEFDTFSLETAKQTLPSIQPIGFRSKVFSLEALPMPFRETPFTSDDIVEYLIQYLPEQAHASECCFLLPSLAQFANFFSVSKGIVHRAFRQLKQIGYDLMIPGAYGHISLWFHPVIPLRDVPSSPTSWQQHVAFIYSSPKYNLN